MTYKVNDTILYSTQGVCKISEISEMDLSGSNVEYYVLKPVYEDNSTIFIPVNNETLTTKMRRVLSSKEIYDLIKTMPGEETIWIENENARRGHYKEILMRCNPIELIRLIKTLYLRQQTQQASGKKLHTADETFMKSAEKILYEEFAYVLDIKLEQVLPLIMEHTNLKAKEQSNYA